MKLRNAATEVRLNSDGMKDIAQKSSSLERRNFVSDLAELKIKLAMSSRMLFNAGLVDYSGHISVRIPRSDHLLILPHPVSRATVKPDDMRATSRGVST